MQQDDKVQEKRQASEERGEENKEVYSLFKRRRKEEFKTYLKEK